MLLPVLLFALAAAPASAAVRPKSCLHDSSGAAPASLDALLACQDKARAAAVAAAQSKGTPLTEAQLDALDEFHRAEARKFLAQSQLVISGPPPAPGAGSSNSGSSTGKLGGVTAADLARVDAKTGASIQGLQGRLQAAAGDGKNGITPSMADDIRATLTSAQGSISPEMQDLLNSVQKDGGKLTPGTMIQLQSAGKAAKASGLNLNIDANTEKALLETDFSKDAAAPPPGM
jgi:hypothetical protein